jgi:hypothetical protein
VKSVPQRLENSFIRWSIKILGLVPGVPFSKWRGVTNTLARSVLFTLRERLRESRLQSSEYYFNLWAGTLSIQFYGIADCSSNKNKSYQLEGKILNPFIRSGT